MTQNKILNQELIEKLISTAQFNQLYFSSSYLEKYLKDKTIQEQVYKEITAIMKTSELICDELRSAKVANYGNFKNLLNKEYSFSDEIVSKELYNYGMFVSR